MGKKITASLLDNPVAPKQYRIRIELRGGQWVEMSSSTREILTQEYDRIRAAGVYGGLWITQIELIEQ